MTSRSDLNSPKPVGVILKLPSRRKPPNWAFKHLNFLNSTLEIIEIHLGGQTLAGLADEAEEIRRLSKDCPKLGDSLLLHMINNEIVRRREPATNGEGGSDDFAA